MEILKVGLIGITGVILALVVKQETPAIALVISLSVAALLMITMLGKLEQVKESLYAMESITLLQPAWLKLLIKITGIAYGAEFSANLCKDAGYQMIAEQILMFGKLSIMAVSLPVAVSLLEMIQTCFL